MPNRLLRDWTDSFRMNSLSADAERFFVRLIMKADDFGCYHAHPRLLRSHLFPLADAITEADILQWLQECEAQGLLRTYTCIKGASYLEIKNFGQKVRVKNRKYPEPPAYTGEVVISAPDAANSDKNDMSDLPPAPAPNKALYNVDWDVLQQWIADTASVLLTMPEPLSYAQYEKLRLTYSEAQIRELLLAISNAKNLSQKRSVYATFLNWAPGQRWSHIDYSNPNFNPKLLTDDSESESNSQLKEKLRKAAEPKAARENAS